MANQTLPGFSGKIRGAMSETKYQSRIRNDVYASSRYARRLDIDHRMEERRLQRDLKEMEL
jgi:hypothetical protein